MMGDFVMLWFAHIGTNSKSPWYKCKRGVIFFISGVKDIFFDCLQAFFGIEKVNQERQKKKTGK